MTDTLKPRFNRDIEAITDHLRIATNNLLTGNEFSLNQADFMNSSINEIYYYLGKMINPNSSDFAATGRQNFSVSKTNRFPGEFVVKKL